MELKTYLRILVAKWWIVLPIFLVTVGVTAAFTLRQPPTYESVASYVLRPRLSEADNRNAVGALSILGSPEIAGTIVEVANSRLIVGQAVSQFNPTVEQISRMSASSRKVPGTNVIEISVQGSDPALIRDVAAAIGEKTVAYVLGMYSPYELQQIDQPALPISPIKPKKEINLALGALAGLLLGAGLAFTAHYLQSPSVYEAVADTPGR